MYGESQHVTPRDELRDGDFDLKSAYACAVQPRTQQVLSLKGNQLFALDEARHKTYTSKCHTNAREGTEAPAALLRRHSSLSRTGPAIRACSRLCFHLNAGGLGWVAARRSAEVSTEDISFSRLSCKPLGCVSLPVSCRMSLGALLASFFRSRTGPRARPF